MTIPMRVVAHYSPQAQPRSTKPEVHATISTIDIKSNEMDAFHEMCIAFDVALKGSRLIPP